MLKEFVDFKSRKRPPGRDKPKLTIVTEPTAVYTAIVGGSDELRIPRVTPIGVDFYCVTDTPAICKGTIWETVPIKVNGLGNYLHAKEVKLFPWRYLPKKYPRSLWIDGNLRLLYDVFGIFDNIKDIGLFEHPQRDCVYEEVRICRKMKRDKPDRLLKVEEYLRTNFYPEGAGLIMGGIIFRKHTKKVNYLMRNWWNHILKFSVRDQLTFNYICWHYGYDFDLLPSTLFRNAFHWGKHKYKDV